MCIENIRREKFVGEKTTAEKEMCIKISVEGSL